MCTISLSLAKPEKAMPGMYSSLMGLRRHASPVDPIRGDCEGIPEVTIGANDRDMSRLAALVHQGHECSHNMQAFSPTVLSNSRKHRFLGHARVVPS